MKTFFFLIIFTISSSLFSQITKGNWLVGGTGDFQKSKIKNTTSNGNIQEFESMHFTISPDIGYFLADKFAAGLVLNFTVNNPSGSNNSSWGYQIGPFARYYFLNTDKIINVFGELNCSFGKGISNQNSDSNSNNYEVKAGTALFFNNSVALELSLNYNLNQLNTNSSDLDTKSLTLGIGFQIHLEK
ncbi:outer membrane beta-barrel protein [Formosa sp. A9]|uniref:outer membrane beta-barrel protein n=1 Tax=Formosa sp. A9 TaxID=3442641 RepID=UPI003EB98E2A